MDERKVRIYTWMVKTGKWTINNVPVEYQEAVANNLPNMNIVDLDKITELEAKYLELDNNQKKTDESLTLTVSNVTEFMDYIFTELDGYFNT
jgi:hypothetical protein